MFISVIRRRDALSGLLFVAFGGFLALLSLRYPLGTAMRMGPGYFPLVLSVVVTLLGVAILVRALALAWGPDHGMEPLALRPLAAVGGGILAFAAVLGSLGLILSTFALVGLSGLAHRESGVREQLILGASLSAFAAVVFVIGLGLPLPLLPG